MHVGHGRCYALAARTKSTSYPIDLLCTHLLLIYPLAIFAGTLPTLIGNFSFDLCEMCITQQLFVNPYLEHMLRTVGGQCEVIVHHALIQDLILLISVNNTLYGFVCTNIPCLSIQPAMPMRHPSFALCTTDLLVCRMRHTTHDSAKRTQMSAINWNSGTGTMCGELMLRLASLGPGLLRYIFLLIFLGKFWIVMYIAVECTVRLNGSQGQKIRVRIV